MKNQEKQYKSISFTFSPELVFNAKNNSEELDPSHFSIFILLAPGRIFIYYSNITQIRGVSNA